MTAGSAQKTVSPVPHKREDLIKSILDLKKERNAIILAHFYQDDEIQEIADFIGDSLELSRKAASTTADVIVFCGVHFMAETAKILNPKKIVLIPDHDAGCSLADECPADKFKSFLNKYPNHFVVSYINCTAEVKAQSDLICTSSNAVKLIAKIPKEKEIIFAPDRNLARWVQEQTGRKLTIWDGSCIVHETFSEEALLKLKLKYPDAKVIAHPECLPNLLDHSDFIGSTSQLLNFSSQTEFERFIILTEPGILHQMKIRNPAKEFIEVPGIDGCSCNACPYMRLNTLEKLLRCLHSMSPRVEIKEATRLKALEPIKLMLEMSD